MRCRPTSVVGLCLGIAVMAPSLATAASLDQALAQWKRNMIEYGARHCAELANPRLTADDRLAATYYDQMRVMAQIGDFTGQSSWKECVARARKSYRDAYVLVHDAHVPGYWNFTTGLRIDYERARDAASRTAVLKLSQNAAYCRDSTPADATAPHPRSREVAYCIVALIDAEAVGGPARRRRAALVTQAYGHIDQWFGRFEWSGDDLAPFMVGLTAHALIRDWEATGDPRLISALRRAADWLWGHAWVPRDQSMWYRSGERGKGAPDLNLLIAPMFAFLYRHTAEMKYRTAGDALFEGGVARAWHDGAKQFNQQYWWSFDFVKWRFGDR
jgi:hypothetical protein